jgi:hypothetical protein
MLMTSNWDYGGIDAPSVALNIADNSKNMEEIRDKIKSEILRAQKGVFGEKVRGYHRNYVKSMAIVLKIAENCEDKDNFVETVEDVLIDKLKDAEV